ncbi:MAG: hypothetical protein UZ22_OP11002000828 [Microgenomates bacterium OLB23]|nr:MAG: hypothetical protein UZ22_OP11002000828 [Microgenomates bacterium OLB23]
MGAVVDGLILTFTIFIAVVIALAFSAAVLYVVVMLIKMKKREEHALESVTMEIRLPKDNELKIDAAEQMFASFASLKNSGFWSFLDIEDTLAFEIIGTPGRIAFYITVPNKLKDLVEKQIYAFYPNSDISVVEEQHIFSEKGHVAYAGLKLKHDDFEPIKTYKELPYDSLSDKLLPPLSKMSEGGGGGGANFSAHHRI